MLKKLLDGLGMESIPKNVMPRGDIPEILLRDMISADDEEQEKAIDDAQYETTDDKFQKKKIMVFGNIGRSFLFCFVLFCYCCFRHCFLSLFLPDSLFNCDNFLLSMMMKKSFFLIFFNSAELSVRVLSPCKICIKRTLRK